MNPKPQTTKSDSVEKPKDGVLISDKPKTELETLKSSVQESAQEGVDKKLKGKGTKQELEWLKKSVENKSLDSFKKDAEKLNEEYLNEIETDLDDPKKAHEAFANLCGITFSMFVLPLLVTSVISAEELKTKSPQEVIKMLQEKATLTVDQKRLLDLLTATLKTPEQTAIWNAFIEKAVQAVPYVEGARKALSGEKAITEADKVQEKFYKKHPYATAAAVVIGTVVLYKAAKWIFGDDEKDSSQDGSDKKMSWWKKTGIAILGFFGIGQVLGLDAVKNLLKGTWLDIDSNRLLKGLVLATKGEFKEACKVLGGDIYNKLAEVFGWEKIKAKAEGVIEDAKETLGNLDKRLHLTEARDRLTSWAKEKFPDSYEKIASYAQYLTPESVMNWAKENGFKSGNIIEWIKENGIEVGSLAATYILLGRIVGKNMRGKIALPVGLYLFATKCKEGSWLNETLENGGEYMEKAKDAISKELKYTGIPWLPDLLDSFDLNKLTDEFLDYINENPLEATAIMSGAWFLKGYIWAIAKVLGKGALKAAEFTGKHIGLTATLATVGWVKRRDIIDSLVNIVDLDEGEKAKFKQTLLKLALAEGKQSAVEKTVENVVDTGIDVVKGPLTVIKKALFDRENLALWEDGKLMIVSAKTLHPIGLMWSLGKKEAIQLKDALFSDNPNFVDIATPTGGLAIISYSTLKILKNYADQWKNIDTLSDIPRTVFSLLNPISKQNFNAMTSGLEWMSPAGKLKRFMICRDIDLDLSQARGSLSNGNIERARNYLSKAVGQISDVVESSKDGIWGRAFRNSAEWDNFKGQFTQMKASMEDLMKNLKPGMSSAEKTEMLKELKGFRSQTNTIMRMENLAHKVAGRAEVTRAKLEKVLPKKAGTETATEALLSATGKIEMSADKWWYLTHCKKAKSVEVILEKSFGRKAFMVNGIDKFDDAVKAFASGKIGTPAEVANYADNLGICVGKVSFVFKAGVVLSVAGTVAEAWSFYQKLDNASKETNPEVKKIIYQEAAVKGVSLGVSATVTGGGLYAWIMGGTAAGAGISVAATAGVIMVPVAEFAYAFEKAGQSRKESKMNDKDWERYAKNDTETLYQLWLETDDTLRAGDAYRIFGSTYLQLSTLGLSGGATTRESVTKEKGITREQIAKSLVNLTFSEKTGWTEDEKNAAFLVVEKEIGKNGYVVNDQNEARAIIEKAGNILTVIRSLKDKDPDFLKEPIFGRVLEKINMTNSEIVKNLTSHDLSMISKKYERLFLGKTKENMEKIDEENIKKAKNIEEYVLYKYAEFMGYQGKMDIDKLKDRFFTEALGGQHGVYFKGKVCYLTEAGMEFDDQIAGEGKTLLLAIASRLQEQPDNIFETRMDSVFQSASSDSLKNQALSLAKLIQAEISKYQKYRRPETSAEVAPEIPEAA